MVSMRFLAFLFATAAMAVTPPPETQALQTLLNEVHQPARRVADDNLTTQRVQIVFRLMSQMP